MNSVVKQLIAHQKQLKKCAQCELMEGVPVHGSAINSSIILIGQAPGIKEAQLDKPFAWTAGKTLFKWFNRIGVNEERFRKAVYMTAVCRCFPGRKEKGGDRVPNKEEIRNCSQWLFSEIDILKPELIILVGKLSINQVRPIKKLTEIIGSPFSQEFAQHSCDFIALPHPSGASTWPVTEPGKTLLDKALKQISSHPAWQKALNKR